MACTDPPSYAQKLDGCLCCQSDQTLSTICIQLKLVSGGYSCEYKIRTAWCMKNRGSKVSLIQWFLYDSALVSSYHREKRLEDQEHNLRHLQGNIQPDLYGPSTVFITESVGAVIKDSPSHDRMNTRMCTLHSRIH
jgi:hypothetical protein